MISGFKSTENIFKTFQDFSRTFRIPWFKPLSSFLSTFTVLFVWGRVQLCFYSSSTFTSRLNLNSILSLKTYKLSSRTKHTLEICPVLTVLTSRNHVFLPWGSTVSLMAFPNVSASQCYRAVQKPVSSHLLSEQLKLVKNPFPPDSRWSVNPRGANTERQLRFNLVNVEIWQISAADTAAKQRLQSDDNKEKRLLTCRKSSAEDSPLILSVVIESGHIWIDPWF